MYVPIKRKIYNEREITSLIRIMKASLIIRAADDYDHCFLSISDQMKQTFWRHPHVETIQRGEGWIFITPPRIDQKRAVVSKKKRI